MSAHRLLRHPASSCTAIERIDVALAQDARGALHLRYRLTGDLQRLVLAPLPMGARPQRRDELWRHTCCELFVHDEHGSGYREYNFAPCGDWAAYAFSGYRAGMALLDAETPRIMLHRAPSSLELAVTLDDRSLDALHARRIGLACIVETADELSYWALAHPCARPDFHHPAAFALTPERAHGRLDWDSLAS